LGQVPDRFPEAILQAEWQASERRLIFLEPGQPVDRQARIRKGDALPGCGGLGRETVPDGHQKAGRND